MRQLLVLGLECAEVVEDGEALVEDGLAGEREAVLREVAEGHALDAGELAVVERLDAGEYLEEVDLPVPLPPTRPVRSFGVMSQFTSSKSSFGPNRLPAADSCSIH